LADAQFAIEDNTDPEAIQDLIQALQDANTKVSNKEKKLTRAEEYYNLLQADFDRLNQERDGVLAERLTAEIADA
jgi:hypothetical protein